MRSRDLALHLLNKPDDDPAAVCLDGSPGGFYFASASVATDSNKWVIHLEGGGWCYTPAQCFWRAGHQSTGSSRSWSKTARAGRLTDDVAARNPDFHGFNHVRVMYCDGGSFSGDTTIPYTSRSGREGRLHFRGRRILAAVLRRLASASFGLAAGAEVLLTGCSAGGLAALLQADYVRSLLPGAVAKYKVAPCSGFFQAHGNARGTPVWESQMQGVALMQNLSQYSPSACLSTMPEQHQWRCVLPSYALRFVQAPVFLLDSVLDSWQLACILHSLPIVDPHAEVHFTSQCKKVPERIAYVKKNWVPDFCEAVITSQAVTNRRNGVFITSIRSHCPQWVQQGVWTKYLLSPLDASKRKEQSAPMSMQQALGQWWREDSMLRSPGEGNPHVYIPPECSQAQPHYRSGTNAHQRGLNASALAAEPALDVLQAHHGYQIRDRFNSDTAIFHTFNWFLGMVAVLVALLVVLNLFTARSMRLLQQRLWQFC